MYGIRGYVVSKGITNMSWVQSTCKPMPSIPYSRSVNCVIIDKSIHNVIMMLCHIITSSREYIRVWIHACLHVCIHACLRCTYLGSSNDECDMCTY